MPKKTDGAAPRRKRSSSAGEKPAAGEGLTGSVITPTADEKALPDGHREWAYCRDDTGRVCLHVGKQAFRVESERQIATINRNLADFAFFYRPATPLDHILFETPPVLRERLLAEGSRYRVLKGAARGSGGKLDGQAVYALRPSAAASTTEAFYDQDGHLLGSIIDDFKHWPSKTTFEGAADVTTALLAPPAERWGAKEAAGLFSGARAA